MVKKTRLRQSLPFINRKAAWFDPAGYGCYYQGAGWSSPVARWAHNPKVAGSNPAPATNNGYLFKDFHFQRMEAFLF
jgi:hypothetical protein